MKAGFFFIVLTAMSIVLTAQKKSAVDTRLAGLDAELQKVLETWKAPGFAVAVVEKNKIIYAKGFGYSNYEKKIAVTPNTLFAIGSCSKAFTSAILGQLRSESKLAFEDKPTKYIPDLKFFNDQMNNTIQIRDLMSHRTGLPRHDFSWYLFPSDSKDSLIQRIAYQEPFAGVREKWYYNNFMFLAQGVVAEKITGKSWEENVRERIFKPLGMERSNLSIPEMQKATDIAIGYGLKNETTIDKMDYYHIAGMAPAGSINSSVNEMSNWVITWINGGKFNGKEIIPASYVSEAMSSQMVIGAGLPDKTNPDLHLSNYGYGWFLSSYKGHYRVEHGGNIDGFSANTSFFPSDSVGIVVLVNQNGSSVPSVVRNIISDRILKVKTTDWNKDLKDRRDKALAEQMKAAAIRSSNKVKGTRPSHILAEFTGKYSHPAYGEFTITYDRDSLFANFKRMKLWLAHHHYDVFNSYAIENGKPDTTSSNTSTQFQFFGNEVGEISKVAIKLEPTLAALEFKRTPIKVNISKEELASYAGEFELGGMVAKFFVKNATLHLTVPGQPQYELVPTGKHKFMIKGLEGFKIEFVEDKSSFSEAVFNQPNGVFRAKRK
ncbi:MAG: serine hydrolase [Cyclobacteriaceae bacterium]|nr:serine hydrolase [Cyclobacteriaceae bacterium]